MGARPQDLSGIELIRIDEISRRRGHCYLALVYRIDAYCKRLLWVGRDRKIKTLLGFFRWLGPERSAGLKYVCSDMWKPYLKVIAKKASQAIHVLDRFHIMAHFSKALDEVRAGEAKALKENGYEPVLSKSRWLLLNWFRAKGQLSSGVVEGFNAKAKLTSRKSFGFRASRSAEIALYHALGALPKPEFTHRFD